LIRFVLDASVALAWCFEDEVAADGLLSLMISAEALVPSIWPVEIGNALLVAERRRRITATAAARHLALLASLNIQIAPAPSLAWIGDLLPLARRRNLALYDACYLSLASREQIPLATIDAELARAARLEGVTVLKA
jgi:predicted nucleic acid-binding protein